VAVGPYKIRRMCHSGLGVSGGGAADALEPLLYQMRLRRRHNVMNPPDWQSQHVLRVQRLQNMSTVQQSSAAGLLVEQLIGRTIKGVVDIHAGGGGERRRAVHGATTYAFERIFPVPF
jgi:hypothetical protein